MSVVPSRRTPRAAFLSSVCAVVVASLLPVLATPAAADTEDEPGPTSWEVQPSGPEGPGERPYFVYDVEAGGVVEDVVGITNHSEHDLTLQVFGTDALNTAAGEFDLLASAEGPQDVGSWVTLDRDVVDADGAVTVPARSRVDVPFWIDVPDNATPGDHVGGIVTSLPTVRTTDDGQEVLVDARIAARVYLAVKGDLAPQLRIEDFEATYSGDWWNPFDGEVEATWTVHNDGNIRLAGETVLTAAGMAGVGRTTVTEDVPEVLPGNSVEMSAVLDGIPAGVKIEVDGELTPVDASERITAPIEPVRYGTSMWVIPWLLVAALVVLGFALWLTLKLRRRRAAELADLRAQVEAAKAGAEAEGSDGSEPAVERDEVPATTGRTS